MSLDRAMPHLSRFGLEDRVKLFDVSSATVELAAQAVGCQPERIAKTLSFLLPEGPVLILAAGDARIDNGKYKARFHTKARMIPHDEVEPLIGHGVGGVCPFGVNEGIPVYLDESLRRFDVVYPAAGTPNSAVELSLEELERASQASGWVDVCKDWG
ncbi:MAG TPA: YbaK/EbsC family protein [Candidatus Enterenecus stercoripullorum]|nr:YbaK/EbsC family protein [Candidatus Enterenecus stercoripullorum]